ncbi:MAG: hypothetical protein WCW40_06805 [Bacteroidota bacterium]
MDKRIIIIASLTVLAVILTVVRESHDSGAGTFSMLSASKQKVSGDRVHRMADTTLHAFGIKKENIRPVKNRKDVRVLMPPSFDPLAFVKAMKDSLEEYDAEIISIENAKEKTSVVQIKDKEEILKSYIFSKEPVTAARKGASPSVPKKQPR